jgi:hypothetical protein
MYPCLSLILRPYSRDLTPSIPIDVLRRLLHHYDHSPRHRVLRRHSLPGLLLPPHHCYLAHSCHSTHSVRYPASPRSGGRERAAGKVQEAAPQIPPSQLESGGTSTPQNVHLLGAFECILALPICAVFACGGSNCGMNLTPEHDRAWPHRLTSVQVQH